MIERMARAATTSDVFNAIAEPRRRDILMLLRAGERPVHEVAEALGMPQPGASKHLRVLREVGLVQDRRAGKQRVYGPHARGLAAVHEWTTGQELLRVDAELALTRGSDCGARAISSDEQGALAHA